MLPMQAAIRHLSLAASLANAAQAMASGPVLSAVLCESTHTALVEITNVDQERPFSIDEHGTLLAVEARIEELFHGSWPRRSFRGPRVEKLKFLAYVDRGMPFAIGEKLVLNFVYTSNGIRFYDVGGAWKMAGTRIPAADASLDEFVEQLTKLRLKCGS